MILSTKLFWSKKVLAAVGDLCLSGDRCCELDDVPDRGGPGEYRYTGEESRPISTLTRCMSDEITLDEFKLDGRWSNDCSCRI